MKQLYRVCLIVIVVLTGLSMGGGETAVFAQISPQNYFTGANWVITVAVENGQPQFTWRVYVWIPGEIGVRLQTTLNCTIDPSVTIHNDHLNFAGNGAIHCPIPSFAADVAQLTGGKLVLPPQIAPSNLFVEADLDLMSPTNNQQNMSVFSHPDFHYDTVIHEQTGVVGAGLPAIGEQRIVSGQTIMTTSKIAVTPATTTLGIFKQNDGSFLHLQDGFQLNEETTGNNLLVGTYRRCYYRQFAGHVLNKFIGAFSF